VKNAFVTSGTSPTLDPKSDSLAVPSPKSSTDTLGSGIDSRIDTARFARILRQRLEARHARDSAVRRLLDAMTDEQVVAAYSDHSRIQARQRAAKGELTKKDSEFLRATGIAPERFSFWA
jgi:hypothetical protein